MTGQNRSSAVMAQRIEPDDSLDDFPTPPLATRALVERVLIPFGLDRSRFAVWEPACNRGHMAAPLEEYAVSVMATDIADYSAAEDLSPHWVRSGRRFDGLLDFTNPNAENADAFALAFAGSGSLDRWVITNPPFKAAAEFQARAAALGVHCALFLRTAFVEGGDRYHSLFSDQKDPPAIIAHFSERILLLKERLVRKGAIDPKVYAELIDDDVPPATARAKARTATATAYSWFIWNRDWREAFGGTRTVWIAPDCAQSLERDGDYPAYPEGFFDQVGVRPDCAASEAGESPVQGSLF